MSKRVKMRGSFGWLDEIELEVAAGYVLADAKAGSAEAQASLLPNQR
jgi:hypothetical protein